MNPIPRMQERFLLWPLACLLMILMAVQGCSRDTTGDPSTPSGSMASVEDGAQTAPVPSPEPSGSAPSPIESETLLTEVTEAWGLASEAGAWPDGNYMTPEITPGGLALLDYDQDGDLDIYQVCHSAPARGSAAFRQPALNRLFRQESEGVFVEVEGAAGLGDPGFGHGCALGDYDNDGDVDVFVTNYGENALFENEGDTFVDVTPGSGLQGDHWSSASAFFDYNRDGDLDLFVVNFGVFDATRTCSAAGDPDQPDYCGPHLFDGVTDQLFRNNGDGTFTEVGSDNGIVSPARGWGVICADLTGDGWPDVYVCNDEEPNQLYVNDGSGGFFEEAMLRGAALNGFGRVEASMGVSVGDVNGDGNFDLFMTHVASESNTLYTFEDGETFSDASPEAGMTGVDLPYTGWGCALFDLDHDADLDLAIGNGRVASGPVPDGAKLGPYWNRYAEGNLLFLNSGGGKFENASSETGSFHTDPQLTRGMAFGDLDNDGDIDVVTNGIDNRLRAFRNDASKEDHHWLQLRLLTGGRDAIGAKAELEAGGIVQVRLMLRSYSYLASNDPRVHFGLGEAEVADSVIITWPDGTIERFGPFELDQEVTLRQGDGEAAGAE